ncbi:FAD binding domain-containing protein [Nocardia jiangxiensis]|uniref:FAD binding domain-containing protein n=1 Tax=Nocardia jiangxiensis TaxID=282685 RepID=UPI00030CCF0D|nr:xanthine dehydrogenase family protein subunit M [Nocardia jiangxiensis]
MKPAPFEYHAPTTAREAVELLAELGDGAKAIAGGQSLMPMLILRLAVFDHLVDLRHLDELRGIETRGDSVRIGAGTTHSAVGRSAEIRSAVPLLSRATPHIGHLQIRNRGTIGGSIAHADAAGEYPAVALTLDADFEALSPRGRRTIPAADFFTGMWSTALTEDELLTGVVFPRWEGRFGCAIEEFARRRGDFAIAGAAVAVGLDADSRVGRSAIGLFGVGPTAIRARTAEHEVIGCAASEISAENVGRAAVAELGQVPSDLHGSAEFRRHVAAVMVAHAWQRALEEALDD